MAITPNEASKINDAHEKKAIKEMEEHIDGVLNKEFRTGTKVRVDSSGIRKAAGEGFSKRALDEVLSRFRVAGWSIKKKKTQERYGMGVSDWEFSEAAATMAQLQADSLRGPPSQWAADNQGLPPEAQR